MVLSVRALQTEFRRRIPLGNCPTREIEARADSLWREICHRGIEPFTELDAVSLPPDVDEAAMLTPDEWERYQAKIGSVSALVCCN